MVRRCLAISLIAGFLGACHSASTAANPAPVAAEPASNPTIVTRANSITDDQLAERHQGRLEVVVRSGDRPAQSLPNATVNLRVGEVVSRRKISDGNGVAQFDSIPGGTYQVEVLRVGYGRARIQVSVKDGCRTDVEVYVPVIFLGLSDSPPTPVRSTITTCRP